MPWRITIFIWMLLLLAGCGKKGALLPPEARVPVPIADLRVQQKGEDFLLSWTRPETEEKGAPLRNLSGFRVLRREVLPPGQDCEQCPDAYRIIRSVDLEYLQGAARVGDRFYCVDADIAPGATYQYKVVSLQTDGSASRDSNKPLRTKVVSPPAPLLSLSRVPGGVDLSWVQAPLPQGVTVTGYNVYRRTAGRPFPPVPINDQPLKIFRFEDRRLDVNVSYTYVVTLLAEGNGQLTESSPSNEVTGGIPLPEK